MTLDGLLSKKGKKRKNNTKNFNEKSDGKIMVLMEEGSIYYTAHENSCSISHVRELPTVWVSVGFAFT